MRAALDSWRQEAGRGRAPGARLVEALRHPQCFPHPVTKIEVIETHISWIVLTGPYAYKIKKPVKLPFLDFSTLELRRHFCEEELRLHRPLAPALYVDVVPIRGTIARPLVNGPGPTLEYAVKMRQFPQEALASTLAADGKLTAVHITRMATDLARFHSLASVAKAETAYGGERCVRDQMGRVIQQLLPLAREADDALKLQALWVWIEQEYSRLEEVLAARKRNGFVRECHGDLHLGNVVLINGLLTPFDGIEFNPALRWVDVMSEVAFPVMDLVHGRRSDLASLFVDAYLERTGDYEGLSVLRFYLVYRALVRALARALLARQHHAPSQDPFRVGSAASYTRLATRYAHAGRGAIFIMHGLSGCGKSTIATALVASLGAVRIRSDVERKRLYGFSALGRTGSAPGSGIYTEAATRATYGRLHEIARSAAQAGFPVIVDAAFLKHSQREDFRRLAEELRLPFAIVSVDAPADILRERLRERSRSGSDASEADPPVLQQQIATQEPLSQAESSDALLIDGARSFAGSARKAVVETLAARARLDSGGIGGGVIPLRQPRAPQYNGEIESAG